MTLELGILSRHYDEYKLISDATSNSPDEFVAWYPNIAKDKGEAGFTVSATRAALGRAGFGAAMRNVFGQLENISDLSEAAQVKLEKEIETMQELAAVHPNIRSAHTILSDGYYWGGKFIRTKELS